MQSRTYDSDKIDPLARRALDPHYEILVGQHPLLDVELLCKHCGGRSPNGTQAIIGNVTAGSPEVRKALNHGRRCKVVQGFKRAGQHERIGGCKPKATVVASPRFADDHHVGTRAVLRRTTS